ncbi:MAG: response regulator transcription factor, partial [Acidimicrobiales bacterium]
MSRSEPVRVVLADDHTLLREGLRRSLEEGGIVVVAEAADGDQAILLAEEHRPDVVLMDVSMPGVDGVEATRTIRSRMPDVDVVILTMHADQSVIEAAVRAGAAGYLVKDCTTDEILATIEAVAGGEVSLSPGLASSILADAGRAAAVPASPSEPVLTQREQQVLALIAE